MSRAVRALPVTGAAVDALVSSLADALDGTGPALLPVPDGVPGHTLVAAARPDDGTRDGVALLLPTSGSTAAAKVVELSAAALVASARATHDRLGGPGAWLLALPLTHVAGWQVLVRSAVAAAPLAVLGAGPFTATSFVRAARRLRHDGPRYVSLVPTQLGRLLDDPTGTGALAAFDAVLVGGAATPQPLLGRARDAGVAVRTTYGMTETSGGCVYDGRPLDGVHVRVDAGRVLLAGPVLAEGYRREPELTAATFVTETGTRWFRTGDRGSLAADGTLTVHGRLDDVIVSGGTNISPAAVEEVITALDGVESAVVVGVPDPEWGRAVVALVQGRASADDVRAAVAERLGRECAPRHVLAVTQVPLRGIGKPDRAAAERLATERLAYARRP